jgi:hypothetical protein
MRKRKKLQRVDLLPVEHQDRIAAWLNATMPMPAVPDAKPIIEDTNAFMAAVKLDMEYIVLCELSAHVRACKEVPAEIRMSAWSIFELPESRWHAFPFFFEGRIVVIPVVHDPRVSPGKVHCVSIDETRIAVRAVSR